MSVGMYVVVDIHHIAPPDKRYSSSSLSESLNSMLRLPKKINEWPLPKPVLIASSV